MPRTVEKGEIPQVLKNAMKGIAQTMLVCTSMYNSTSYVPLQPLCGQLIETPKASCQINIQKMLIESRIQYDTK